MANREYKDARLRLLRDVSMPAETESGTSIARQPKRPSIQEVGSSCVQGKCRQSPFAGPTTARESGVDIWQRYVVIQTVCV